MKKPLVCIIVFLNLILSSQLLGSELTGECSYNGITFQYKEVDDGLCIIKGDIPDGITDIDIPDSINGLYVVEIGECAFASTNLLAIASYYDSMYTEYFKIYYTLKLPRRIKRIGAKAFFERNFKNATIEFPSTVEVLDQFAFGYWQGAGYYTYNGSYHTEGAWPSRFGDVIFYGPKPRITNTMDLPNSSSLTSVRKSNYMFFESQRLMVGDVYFNQYVTSHYYSNIWFAGQYVSVGFIEIGVSRNPIEENGFGNVISLSCATNGVDIYYTTDGTAPVNKVTDSCSKYESPIVMGTGTIRAIVYDEQNRFPYTKEFIMDFKEGEVLSPAIESSMGIEYWSRDNVITIVPSISPDSTIRYTLDNTPVTEGSPIYTGPILISDTTTIRAKAFKENWFDSDEVVQTFTRMWYKCETPVTDSESGEFADVAKSVSLACDTEDATILYTTDGSDPAENGIVYTKPFEVYKTTTVRAIARKDDWKDSEEVTATYTRQDALGEAADLFHKKITGDSNAEWTVDTTESHDGVSSVRSGEISDGGSTYMQTSVTGAGQISFWWKASCEDGDATEGYYDYGVFKIGGVAQSYIAGKDTEPDNGWKCFVADIQSAGKHILRWEYIKDDEGGYGDDCIWVDQIKWIPASENDTTWHTVTTPEPVPYSWLKHYGWTASCDYEAIGAALSGKTQGGNQTKVWEEYVAGTDPTNTTSVFKSKIEMVDGTPKVTWEPDLNENGAKSERLYKVWGKESLTDLDWIHPTNSLHRFFKVTVEMP